MKTLFNTHQGRLALALLSLTTTPPILAAQARVEGTVALRGGSPADDAEVALSALGLRTRVDATGRFALDDVPTGTWLLEATSPRWGRAIETVVVPASGTVRVSVVLQSVFHLDELVVSAAAGAVRRSEAYQPASVVTSRDLLATAESSLGETLSREAGVTSTFYGPGASRPIIRGLGGDRIRVLEGGVGVGDASGTSPDHAVAVEARTADRIEVLRGPATLMYGSAAVGGIVNVLDSRIPRERPEGRVSGSFELLGTTVSDERTASGRVSATAGGVVFTGSGLARSAADYRVPAGAASRGTLANSAVASRQGSMGVGMVGARGYLGAAWSRLGSEYGVPGTEGTTIDLDQDRVDLEGTLRTGGGAVGDIRARVGIADYRHVELEGEEVGTTFLNDYVEARIDAQHRLGGRLAGAVGAQFSSRDLEARGDEAFVPPSSTRTLALFAYEEFTAAEALRVLVGLRVERQRAEASSLPLTRSDDALSASLGANWDASDVLSVSSSLSRSVKLPNAEELFSNGPHAATLAYEIGDPDLNEEVAMGADVTAHLHAERLRGTASVFVTSFDGYIHERGTGGEEDGLRVYRFTQAPALFRGFELDTEVDLLEGDHVAGDPHLSVHLLADYVTARLTDLDEFLPRIPPLRLGTQANLSRGPLRIQAGARRTFAQGRVGAFEDATPGYTTVDASASFRFMVGRAVHDVTLVGSNLTDAEARLHTSFLKSVAPLPGRSLRLVYRVDF